MPLELGNLHEFHLSKSTINFDTKSNSLQVTMHIFIDDLETALAELEDTKLYIGTEKEDSKADHFIAKYIFDHFELRHRDSILEQSFLGKELSNDLVAIWCYIEVPIEGTLESLKIKNNLLMEVFDDQKNVITIKKDKKRKDDLLLNKDDFEAKIEM